MIAMNIVRKQDENHALTYQQWLIYPMVSYWVQHKYSVHSKIYKILSLLLH